jgi:hypothetical protein
MKIPAQLARLLLSGSCAGALLAGCASAPPPTARLSDAEAAIRGAMEVEASSVPRAALHLKLAQEQVDKAKRYMQDELNDRAELALRRALADAELAIALSREQDMTSKAKAAQAKVEKLRATKAL